MEQTKHNLSRLVRVADLEKTYEEIAEQYKKNLDPSLLAVAYQKVFGIVVKLYGTSNHLTQDDMASISVEKLDMCLQNFDPEKGVKFSTYYMQVLGNEVRQTYRLSQADVRVLNYNGLMSYDSVIDDGFEIGEDSYHRTFEELYSFVALDDREQQVCDLLMQGYSKVEIANIFKLTGARITQITKTIQLKMTPLLK